MFKKKQKHNTVSGCCKVNSSNENTASKANKPLYFSVRNIIYNINPNQHLDVEISITAISIMRKMQIKHGFWRLKRDS